MCENDQQSAGIFVAPPNLTISLWFIIHNKVIKTIPVLMLIYLKDVSEVKYGTMAQVLKHIKLSFYFWAFVLRAMACLAEILNTRCTVCLSTWRKACNKFRV